MRLFNAFSKGQYAKNIKMIIKEGKSSLHKFQYLHKFRQIIILNFRNQKLY